MRKLLLFAILFIPLYACSNNLPFTSSQSGTSSQHILHNTPILNENTAKQIKHETEAEEQQIILLQTENAIQKSGIQKRNTAIGILSGILLISLIIGYKFKQKARLQAEIIRQERLAAKGIIEADERERKRVSGELHDGVGQLLTTIKTKMEILTERFLIKQPDADALAKRTMAMIDESCTDARSIAHRMMPSALIKNGLASALHDLVNNVSPGKLKVSIETSGINNGLESSAEAVLYRVIQESVYNVIKHADAGKLDILLACTQKEVNISIKDDGVGFFTSDRPRFTGIGLKNMVSRIEYLKGTVDISSTPGKGTQVAIYIPLDKSYELKGWFKSWNFYANKIKSVRIVRFLPDNYREESA